MLLVTQDKNMFAEILKRKNIPYLQKKGLRKKIHDKAKKMNVCSNCGEFNGEFKKFWSQLISKLKQKKTQKAW